MSETEIRMYQGIISDLEELMLIRCSFEKSGEIHGLAGKRCCKSTDQNYRKHLWKDTGQVSERHQQWLAPLMPKTQISIVHQIPMQHLTIAQMYLTAYHKGITPRLPTGRKGP